jgi:hypothetical protein
VAAVAADARADDPRALGADATLADVVAAAAALVDAKPGGAGPGCLLRPAGDGGARLEATIAPVRTSLPPPPAELDAALAASAGVALVTRFGRVGSKDATLALAPLVAVPRTATDAYLLPLLLRTHTGLWFTAITRSESFTRRAQLLSAADRERLRRDVLPNLHAVVVTAEAEVKLADLVDTLRLLEGFAGNVILATPLPADADADAAPPPARAAEDAPDLCRTGIADIPKGARPGELPLRESDRAMEALQRAVTADCAGGLGDDGGGTMMVAMRIVRDGRVGEVCIEKDTSGDSRLRACVRKTAARIRFPHPEGGTFVNFGLEVTLTPASLRQAALCPATGPDRTRGSPPRPAR